MRVLHLLIPVLFGWIVVTGAHASASPIVVPDNCWKRMSDGLFLNGRYTIEFDTAVVGAAEVTDFIGRARDAGFKVDYASGYSSSEGSQASITLVYPNARFASKKARAAVRAKLQELIDETPGVQEVTCVEDPDMGEQQQEREEEEEEEEHDRPGSGVGTIINNLFHRERRTP